MKSIDWGRPNEIPTTNSPSDSNKPATTEEDPEQIGQEEFGIPRDSAFLRAVLGKVRARIPADSAITIEQIIHGQYRESYYFAQDESRCRIDISYNGKSKLTTLIAPSTSDFATQMLHLLAPLKGAVCIAATEASSSERALSKDFLRQFDAELEARVARIGVHIDSAHEQAWSVRYCFVRLDERAIIDFYYNRRDQLKKFAPVWPLCTSNALVADVESLLATGFD